jgi:hypothetical protein
MYGKAHRTMGQWGNRQWGKPHCWLPTGCTIRLVWDADKILREKKIVFATFHGK